MKKLLNLSFAISILSYGVLAQKLPPNPVPVPDGPLPKPLLLSEAKELLTLDYPKMEVGVQKLSDGLHYVATNTWMPKVTGQMIDWWFGYITTTEDYKRWHPTDHIYSEWAGPHGNSKYIGGSHLVYELIGGQQQQLRINFKDPSIYFGADYREKFKAANISTAVVGRVGFWAGKGKGTTALDVGHLMHIVHDEGNGVRMRSRFWLGDVAGVKLGFFVPASLAKGLVKHATEEMAYLRTFLPDFYVDKNIGPRRRSDPYSQVVPWSQG